MNNYWKAQMPLNLLIQFPLNYRKRDKRDSSLGLSLRDEWWSSSIIHIVWVTFGIFDVSFSSKVEMERDLSSCLFRIFSCVWTVFVVKTGSHVLKVLKTVVTLLSTKVLKMLLKGIPWISILQWSEYFVFYVLLLLLDLYSALFLYDQLCWLNFDWYLSLF